MAETGTLSMAERSYPASEVRDGQEEPPRARVQGQWLGGATPRLRPGVAAGRSNPTSEARVATGRSNPMPKEWWLGGCRRA